MISAPFAPRQKIRVNVRPIKYAYLVDESDSEALKRALRLLCTQWGGIRSLIIPIRDDLGIDPWFRDFLEAHEPDRFVYYSSYQGDEFLERSDTIRLSMQQWWPHQRIHLQEGQFFERNDHTAHALSVIPDDLLRTETLEVQRFSADDAEYLTLLTLFGELSAADEQAYLEWVKGGILHHDTTVESTEFWNAQFQNQPFKSVMNLTGYGISPYHVADAFESNRFEIMLGTSTFSLLTYWNFRATLDATSTLRGIGRRLFLLPECLLDHEQALADLVQFSRANLPVPNVLSNLQLAFGCEPEASERLAAVLERIPGIEPLDEASVWVRRPWSRDQPPQIEDFSDRPLKYIIRVPPLPTYFLEGLDYGVAISTDLGPGDNEVLYTPPTNFRNRFFGSMALDLEGEIWQRYPKSSRVCDALKTESWFSRYGLTFTGAIPDRTQYVTFNLIDDWNALELFFQERGITIHPSPIGTYASAFIDLIGGLDRADALASQTAYAVLDALATKSTKKLAQRLRDAGIADADVTLLSRLDLLPSLRQSPKSAADISGMVGVQKRELLPLLTELSVRHILRRGFYLSCYRCAMQSWYPLNQATDEVACLGCSARFPLPVEYPAGSGDELRWSFVLNSLADRVMDQDGMPPILALFHLTRAKEWAGAVLGLELVGRDGTQHELDFIFTSKHELAAGECKAGTELSAKDIEAARVASAVGIQHFYFCTAKQFSDEAVRLIEVFENELREAESTMRIGKLDSTQLLESATH